MTSEKCTVISNHELKDLTKRLETILIPAGFEFYPYKIGWYNEIVRPSFQFPLSGDTLAFIVVSTPHMFEEIFLPYIARQDCTELQDPIDKFVASHFKTAKEAFPEYEVETIHDFELHNNRRPKVLVQTAAHVAGAAYYYQRCDLQNDPWDKSKKIFGVCVHPQYGGWFGLRGVIIFKSVLVPDLIRKQPDDILKDDLKKQELLERFNFHWQDWSFRDVIPVTDRYSELQKQYFSTKPAERKEFLLNYLQKYKNREK